MLHADETPVQQLDPGKGKTKRAYLWAYRSHDLDEGPRLTVFDYQSGRSGEQRFSTRRAAKDEVMSWLLWYNRERLHSTLSYVSPTQYEHSWHSAQLQKTNP